MRIPLTGHTSNHAGLPARAGMGNVTRIVETKEYDTPAAGNAITVFWFRIRE
ncbi:MAG: hypothetical protein WC586_03625 [Methanoregula sp.]